MRGIVTRTVRTVVSYTVRTIMSVVTIVTIAVNPSLSYTVSKVTLVIV